MSTLLSTKLHLPPLRPELVPRSRLVDRLNADLRQNGGFARFLTLVSAPAGYGKTTLVVDWIKHSGLSPGWLSLDEGDNDPQRFIIYLIAALQQVNHCIGQAVLEMLKGPQALPDELMLAALVNEISAISQPILLVLDDYHVIHTLSIHKQIAFLLEHRPANLHLVITTREDPLLPISRLRARGQVLEIRQDDLRFTAGETSDFLNKVMGLDLPSDQVAALERRTEGWIAGLQLAALSMHGREDVPGFIQAFTGSSRFILDYLIEEVFERQSPDVKDFLLKTSALERLSGPLCNQVSERTDSQRMLESLEQANLFIVPLDQSRGWYRYHRLFMELLRHRLRTSPIAEAGLHQRASQWYEQNDFLSDAIHHALAAQEWERAGRLIQRASTDLLKRGEVWTVIGWFQALPQDMLLSNPKLCFEYCWPLLLATQYDLAAPLLERLEGAAKDTPAFLGEVYAAQAYLARGLGEHKRLVVKSQQALALLPESSIHSRGIVALNLGLAYWHMGQMQAAEEVLAEALKAGQKTGNQYAALTAIIFQGRVLAVRGHLHRAMEYFERAIQHGSEIPINALAYMDLATLHYEWNALDDSDACLQKAVVLCQRSQNDEFLVGSLMLQSRLCIARADLAGAESALEQAWTLVRAGKIPEPTAARLDAAWVRLLLAKGESTVEWGQKLTERVDCHPFYRFLGLTKALVLPEAHARAYLDGLSKTAQENDWGYGLVVLRALQATQAENQEEALRFLSEALQMAESGGFIRSFVEAGEKLVPLLREAVRRGIAPFYAQRIVDAMVEKANLTGAGLASLVEPLSEREIEVLRLVMAGLSNREIAGQLFISPGTAKTHIHHLCGKLGVRNRTEAAMKAKEIGLV